MAQPAKGEAPPFVRKLTLFLVRDCTATKPVPGEVSGPLEKDTFHYEWLRLRFRLRVRALTAKTNSRSANETSALMFFPFFFLF